MAFTSQGLGTVLQVDGRATEGGVIEIVPGAQLLLQVGVDSVEGGALLDDIATAVAEAKAARDEASQIAGLSDVGGALELLIPTFASVAEAEEALGTGALTVGQKFFITGA